MKKKSSGISVIIPAYNCQSTIVKCLKAIKDQTLAPEEIIVVDDSSTDGTAIAAREWAQVIKNNKTKGPGGARNTGAKTAKAEILAFTDSDCLPPNDWLEKLALALSDETVMAAGGGYASGIGRSFWQGFCFYELSFRRKDRKDRVTTLVSNNFACRKSVFFKSGGFPEAYPVGEDILLSYRIAQKGSLRWLKDNGVRHHFTDSLKDYLRHQYFFGAESTRLFLQNPSLMTANTHQGKRLYLAVTIASLLTAVAIYAAATFLLKDTSLGPRLLILAAALLMSHYLLYSGFLNYLRRNRFKGVTKAYLVSLLRDSICGISALEGIVRAAVIKKPKALR